MSHNIQSWSEKDSDQTAVKRPWTGVIVSTVGGTVTHKDLVKTEASTRDEALLQLRARTPIGWNLVSALWGDHDKSILRVA
jgi:hypothetical protein